MSTGYVINVLDATGDTWTVTPRRGATLASDGTVMTNGVTTTSAGLAIALQKAAEAIKNYVATNGHS